MKILLSRKRIAAQMNPGENTTSCFLSPLHLFAFSVGKHRCELTEWYIYKRQRISLLKKCLINWSRLLLVQNRLAMKRLIVAWEMNPSIFLLRNRNKLSAAVEQCKTHKQVKTSWDLFRQRDWQKAYESLLDVVGICYLGLKLALQDFLIGFGAC